MTKDVFCYRVFISSIKYFLSWISKKKKAVLLLLLLGRLKYKLHKLRRFFFIQNFYVLLFHFNPNLHVHQYTIIFENEND